MDSLPAHDYPVTAMQQHQTFLVSGDSNGCVKVFDTSNFGVLLQGRVNTGNMQQ